MIIKCNVGPPCSLFLSFAPLEPAVYNPDRGLVDRIQIHSVRVHRLQKGEAHHARVRDLVELGLVRAGDGQKGLEEVLKVQRVAAGDNRRLC